MIWFACKSCGKHHGRPDNLAGTMVFCDCGQGNRVPWSSTVAEPEPEAAPPPPAPRPPEEPHRPPRPPEPADEDAPPMPARRPRPPREPRRINAGYCLNHEDDPSTATCEACRCPFCSACVVTLQGATLCGPCKNFRVRGLHRRARVGPLAIAALVLSLLSGPVTVVLDLMAIGTRAVGNPLAFALLLSLVALLMPAGALALSWAALRQIETTPHQGGRAMAATGAVAGLAGVLCSLSIAVMIVVKHYLD
jgi:hypothetical protein